MCFDIVVNSKLRCFTASGASLAVWYRERSFCAVSMSYKARDISPAPLATALKSSAMSSCDDSKESKMRSPMIVITSIGMGRREGELGDGTRLCPFEIP
jgi:hypothetical protein